MRKKIFIVIAIMVLAALAAVLYAFWRTRGNSTATQGGTGTLPPVVTGTPATNSSTLGAFPSGPTFQIQTSQGAVTVNNFYQTKDYITQDQETVVLTESDTSTIVYDRGDSGFIIAILALDGSSLQAARTAVETDFLNQLGISQSDACKLNVNERVLDKTSPYDGVLMGLSFCNALPPM